MYRRPEADPPILIGLLGSFRVLKAGQLVALGSGTKARALLCLLGLQHDHIVDRDALLNLLWPHADVALGGQSLHSLVHTLHKQLGDGLRGAAPIVYADGYYRFNGEAGVCVDTDLFNSLAESGDQQVQAGNDAGAAICYRQAVELYRGDLCNCTEDSQTAVERECLRARYLTLLLRLAEHHFALDEYATALRYAQRLLVGDPCREDAHRLVMRCRMRRGERSEALRQYRLCESILQTEFAIVPEPATLALYEQVRQAPTTV